MRTIFINRFFYPDHSATSQILSDLAFGLAEENAEIIVITSRQSYDGAGKPLIARETVAGVEIRRLWTTHYGRTSLMLRAIDYLTFYISTAWTLLHICRRGDIVIAMTDPPMLSIIAAPIARFRGARLVNWLQDLFPEIAEALCSSGKLNRILFSGLQRLRNVTLRHSDMNVAIGERMAERLRAADLQSSRISIIPNWADCDSVHPIEHVDNPLRTEWYLADHFVVGYSGNLGRAHEFESLLTGIELTEHYNTQAPELPIKWLFVGGGYGFECVKAEAAKRGLRSAIFRPYQPRHRLAQSLSAADVHLVTLKPDLEGLIVPSKFYGAAAAGRPIIFIGAPDGEIVRLLSRHECGLSVANADATELANAIIALARDPQQAQRMGAHARTACENNYTKQLAICAWANMLSTLSQEVAASTARKHLFLRSGKP